MKQTDNLNQLSKKFLEAFYKEHPRLKEGQVAVFEILSIKEDSLNPGRMKMPFIQGVPSRDRIWDEGDKAYKDIAFIAKIGLNNETHLGIVQFKYKEAGKISCYGGRANDQELYEYLLLSNYRENNKDRDKSKTAIYRLVDNKANALSLTKKRNLAYKALTIAKDMADEKIKILIASKGGDQNQDIDILRNEIESWAERDPEGLIEANHSIATERKAVIKMALDQGEIIFDPAENKFSWKDGKTITIVARATGIDHLQSFYEWTMRDNKSEAAYQEIKKLISGSNKT